MAESMTVAEAAALIDASWKGWIAAIEAVPAARWSDAGVCGEWSIKDLLGHVAVWDQVCVDYLGACARGEQREPLDWQALNDETAAARADRNVAQQRAEMDETHIALLGAFIALASLAMSAYGAFLDRPRTGGGTGGGHSVSDSTIGGRLTMVRNVQGSLRIGTGSAPPPGPAPAPPPGPASPPAPGGQSVSGSQISGDATLVDGVGGDAQVDT